MPEKNILDRTAMDKNQQSAELKGKMEALLFTSNRPLSLKVLARALQLEIHQVESTLIELEEDLRSVARGLQLRNLSGGWRLETKPEHALQVLALNQGRTIKPLSAQALEVLAIVALKQPVTAGQINAVRGVNSLGTVETLRKRKLIAAVAQRPGFGKNTYWRTTQEFLNEFGLASLDEIYGAGKIERVFGATLGLIDISLNNSAQNDSASQELRSAGLENSASKPS